MTQPKVALSPEQAELTFICAERIRAELDLYSVLVSKAEGPPISSLAAVCNIVFQLGIFLANTHGCDPDWYYLGARELVAEIAAGEEVQMQAKGEHVSGKAALN